MRVCTEDYDQGPVRSTDRPENVTQASELAVRGKVLLQREKQKKGNIWVYSETLCGGEPFIDYNLIGNFNGWARYNRINVYFRQFKTL